jgi:hypothetical protein
MLIDMRRKCRGHSLDRKEFRFPLANGRGAILRWLITADQELASIEIFIT